MTSIGSWAFSDCRNLSSLQFAQGSALRVVRVYAFTETAIASVALPQNANVEAGAFDRQTQVTRE